MADRAEVDTGKVLRFTCAEHGEVWSESVVCSHDVETTMKRVTMAHFEPYGAACKAQMTVDLLDADTMEPLDTSKWSRVYG